MRKFLIACLLFSIVSLISTGRYEMTEMSTCDCSYRSKTWYGGGGCIITQAAQKYRACKCSYAAWSCSGKVIPCPDCNNPDTTKKSCLQGGGDCGGY